MEFAYKACDYGLPSRNTESREVLYRFSDLFMNEIVNDIKQENKFDLQSILNTIEMNWMSRENDSDPFPLPPKIELVTLLMQLLNTFKSCPEKPVEQFLDSFYYFITYIFETCDDILIIEIILQIILYSNCEYNNILCPIFMNIENLLISDHIPFDVVINICNRFIFNDNFFEILYKSEAYQMFILLIQTNSDFWIIQNSFYFLNDFLIQVLKLNGENDITKEEYEILEMALIFLRTVERNELLAAPLILLNTFFKSSNPIFLEKSKELGLIDSFSYLLHNDNPEVFLAASKFLDEFCPDCDLFNEGFIYERFQTILRNQDFVDDENDIPIPEKIQKIGFNVLNNLISHHYDQIYKYEIINVVLNNCSEYSFQLKLSACSVLLSFLSFSSIQTRRDLLANYQDETNKIAENAIKLIIDAIFSEDRNRISITIVTLISMLQDDPEFWIQLLSVTNIIKLFENIIEESDEVLKEIVQPLLTFYYSHFEQ